MEQALRLLFIALLIVLLGGDLSARGSEDDDRPGEGSRDDDTSRRDSNDSRETVSRTMEDDKDGDGRITREEASQRLQRLFDRMDSNDDDLIDEAEVHQFLNRNRDTRRARQQRTQRESSNPPQGTRRPRREGAVLDGLSLAEDIAYREGNEAWKLDLYMPESRGTTPRPGLVFVHGGGWRSGDKRRGYFRRGAMDFAQRGYVVISVNYRLSSEASFPACVEDAKCAVRWFRAHAEEYNVAPHRIGGYGNSAGAHLVLMLGLAGPEAALEGDGPFQEHSSMLNAVCASAPPTNFINWSKRPGGMRFLTREKRGLLAGSKESFLDRARRASPLTYVHENAPPLLLFQGVRDALVDVADTDRFVEALNKAGAPDVTYKRYEEESHSVFGARKEESVPLMEDFFMRTLHRNDLQSESE